MLKYKNNLKPRTNTSQNDCLNEIAIKNNLALVLLNNTALNRTRLLNYLENIIML